MSKLYPNLTVENLNLAKIVLKELLTVNEARREQMPNEFTASVAGIKETIECVDFELDIVKGSVEC